jgi:transcription initiation factor TFIIIB Brf1 subunit/transcription initiation factor TFIIB
VFVDYNEAQSICKSCGSVVDDLQLFIGNIIEVQDQCIDFNDSDEDTQYYEAIPDNIIKESKISALNILDLYKFKGINKKSVNAACLFFACKKFKVPRSMEEVSQMYNIPICKLSKFVKKYEYMFHNKDDSNYTTIINADDLLHRFLNNFIFSNNANRVHFKKHFYKLHKACEFDALFEGRSPKSLTASILAYLFENEYSEMNYTRQDVSNILKISLATINKLNKLIVQKFVNF